MRTSEISSSPPLPRIPLVRGAEILGIGLAAVLALIVVLAVVCRPADTAIPPGASSGASSVSTSDLRAEPCAPEGAGATGGDS